MAFTAEQLARGAAYGLAVYRAEALCRIDHSEPKPQMRDDIALLLRRQYIGFGLMVAIVLAAGHGIGRLLGAW